MHPTCIHELDKSKLHNLLYSATILEVKTNMLDIYINCLSPDIDERPFSIILKNVQAIYENDIEIQQFSVKYDDGEVLSYHIENSKFELIINWVGYKSNMTEVCVYSFDRANIFIKE